MRKRAIYFQTVTVLKLQPLRMCNNKFISSREVLVGIHSVEATRCKINIFDELATLLETNDWLIVDK
jgi:hypothetical protein